VIQLSAEEKKTLENEFHEKQLKTSFRRSSRITYDGRTEKFEVFGFRALMD